MIFPNTASMPLRKDDNNAEAVQSKAGMPIQPALELWLNNEVISFKMRDTAPVPDSPMGSRVDRNISKDGKKASIFTKFPTMNNATNNNGNTQSRALKAIPAEMRKRCLEPKSSKKDSTVLYQYVRVFTFTLNLSFLRVYIDIALFGHGIDAMAITQSS